MGQPDPLWADTPEFNWIPDQPFRAEYPAAANLNEPATRHQTGKASAESANSHLPARLMIGVVQGFGLAFLAKDQSISISATMMVFLFVPLLLLARLGPVPGRLLLPWTAITSCILGTSGTYQYWRGGSLGGTAIALTAITLFAGQVLVMVWAKDGKPPV